MTMGVSVRGLGSLFSEWGRMNYYSGSGFVTSYYWTSEPVSTPHDTIDLFNGNVVSNDGASRYYVVCRQGL